MTAKPESFSAMSRALPNGDAEAAFENALAEGRLSHDRDASNYVGDYMWMGWNDSTRRDAFKHRNTRKYLP